MCGGQLKFVVSIRAPWLPRDPDCNKILLAAMQALSTTSAFVVALAVALLGVRATAFEACRTQSTFDITVCKSHLCNECTLAWCSESCQEIQLKNPGCACEHWAPGRKSFSGGDFEGKGKFGDMGDYAKGDTGGKK